jgi:undecaprenyl-diphosphatase
VGGVSALCWLIKLLFGRPRPPIALQKTLETDYSFPSGHVRGTVAPLGILEVVVGLSGSRVAKGLEVRRPAVSEQARKIAGKGPFSECS